MAMINFLVDLSGTKVLKKRKAQKVKIKDKLLPVAWNNGGTGVLLRMKKRNKNCGHKNGSFLCLMAGYKIFFTP